MAVNQSQLASHPSKTKTALPSGFSSSQAVAFSRSGGCWLWPALGQNPSSCSQTGCVFALDGKVAFLLASILARLTKDLPGMTRLLAQACQCGSRKVAANVPLSAHGVRDGKKGGALNLGCLASLATH